MSSPKKKRKLNLKNIFIIIIFLSLISFSFYYVYNLRVKHILILGTSNIKDVEIIEASGLKNYPKMLKTNKSTIKNNIKKLELVNDVEVKRNILGKITITIDENIPLFYYQNKKSTILSNNTMIKSNTFYGLPTIINYVPEDILKDLTTGMTKIDHDIISMINEIEYSPSESDEGVITDPTRFILLMNDGNTVHINTINIKKVSNYLAIYNEVVNIYGEERGLLKLDSDTDAYIFKTYTAIAEEENEKNQEVDEEDES